MSSRRRSGAPCDFEELRPGHFLIHNPALGFILRGEGDRAGDRFTLTSQRGEGLIARLRAHSFSVLTLADQVAVLPALPSIDPPGPPSNYRLANNERISSFDGSPPGWMAVPEVEPGIVSLREGWALRRRRNRGPFSYGTLVGRSLVACDEERALALGYALVALSGPLSISATPDEAGLLLPDLPLPAAYRRLLGRIAGQRAQGWLVPPGGLPSARALLARLGMMIAG